MKRLVLIVIVLSISHLIAADVPVREEKFIYSILAFNGKDYTSTFFAEPSDTIFLIANADNFLSARKTLVYFWPITNDWKTDTAPLNHVFEGYLELKRRGLRFQPQLPDWFTYYNARGEYELNWKVSIGDEAIAVMKQYEDSVRKYEQAYREYERRGFEYAEAQRALTAEISRRMETGEDVGFVISQREAMKEPVPPEMPSDFIVPPESIQKAYILNLPAGEYSIRFRTGEGALMEGSEAQLRVFKKRRSMSVGFDVIPEDKWTRPVASDSPSSIIYVDGKTDLFLRPFFQDEFNDLQYEKMLKNDGRGNPGIMRWVRTQQIPGAELKIGHRGDIESTLKEESFIVEQTTGAALGYRIVPFTRAQSEAGMDPDVKAFRIPLDPDRQVLILRVSDKSGTTFKDSSRQIRVVENSGSQPVLLLLSLLPLLIMAVVLISRSRIYKNRQV